MTRTAGAVIQLSLDNLMTGVTYSFTVAAVNNIGTGPDATMVMFTTIPNGNTDKAYMHKSFYLVTIAQKIMHEDIIQVLPFIFL